MSQNSNAVGSPSLYPEEELVTLVRSLDRESDHHLFSEDVIQTYPQFKEAYLAMCPERSDLATAAEKAAAGAYSSDITLETLKRDIKLMVDNCIRFNGEGTPYAATARQFEKFAFKKVDDYISKKAGGKRASTMRLHASRQDTPGEGSSSGTTGRAGRHAPKEFTMKEAVELVKGLVRREDNGAFETDVAEAYPSLRESYQALCPTPMNLNMMKQRVIEGYYTQPPLFGKTIASSLVALRDDIELIVHNCIRFNSKVETWVQLALSFQRFAHHRVDEYVVRHAPQLRGTTTGASHYVAVAAPKDITPLPTPTTSEATAATTPSLTPSVAAPAVGAKKRARETVQVVADTVVSVSPTPLQPTLEVPPVLRRRVVRDHLQRDSLPVRLLGGEVTRGQLLPAEGSETKPEEGEADDKKKAQAHASEELVHITAELTVESLLHAFEESVKRFFHAQRTRQDFNDPFQFSVKEEETYLRILKVMREQFNILFPQILLYPVELADIGEWTARRAMKRIKKDDKTESQSSDDTRWSETVHICYFVRFLLHFPQLAALACASKNTSQGRQAVSLTISKNVLEVVQQVTRVAQELLNFTADYEQRLLLS
ncbi:hypothetical protein AGDE_02549 [Angomonas deanei]|nr:hypothetical protein AGDE_02549 [Angomonas deanei]|eukprot:EPY41375.1 hypothetical protein AGDE_02549 [Angomonas deanei]